MTTVALKTTWRHALAWRLSRQLLDPVGMLAVDEVVGRLCGVQAQVASSAEQAVRIRQRRSEPGEVGRALAAGKLLKTWAMRGTLHLLTPTDGGAALSLLAAGRSWERPSWQKYFGMTPASMELLRDAVRHVLAGAVLTREELIAALIRLPGLQHVGDGLQSGWGTLLKPLAWQGELVFGPNQGTRVTFTHPKSASSRWRGLPEPDEAAPTVIRSYLAAYGPATPENFSHWLSQGRILGRTLKAWFATTDGVAPVEVGGETAYVLAKDVDELAAARPSKGVCLVGGFDSWVLGPGTADAHVIPSGRRTAVSKQSGWIAPVVLVGGVVAGTWAIQRDLVSIDWFPESGKPPTRAIGAEVARWAGIVGRDLIVEVRPA